MIEELLKALGTTAIIVAALSWLAKSAINQWLNARLASHQQSLREQSDREIELLKSRLNVEASERSAVLDRLTQRRAEIIDELYARFRRSYSSAFMMAGGFFSFSHRLAESRAEAALADLQEFLSYFLQHRIYFSKELRDLVSDFHALVYDHAEGFLMIDGLDEVDKRERRDAFTERFRKSLDDIKKTFDKLSEAIEAEFREVVGVTWYDKYSSTPDQA